MAGDPTPGFDLGQDAAFAMQRNLNIWGTTDSDDTTTDNSD